MTASASPQKGLDHVVMGESRITLVDGEAGGLAYRGFTIEELVDRATFEEVVHLLLHGDPPTAAQRSALVSDLASRRALPDGVTRVLDALPANLPPLEALRTSISALGDGTSNRYPPTVPQGLDLIARAPGLVAWSVRRSQGERPIDPDPSLGHVANFLHVLEGGTPDPRRVKALGAYFILLADHGMNASTFALRVALSTNSDYISAATAALSTLKGPLHGGAPSKVSEMLDAVADPGSAEQWVEAAIARKERLMGFGHRAYKTEDPRAKILKKVARELADPARFRLAEATETAALDALRRSKPGQRLYTNVEFYGALVLEASGLPRELFTPTFALARTAGWAAHAVEQSADNRLIRPEVAYLGPAPGRRWPSAA